MATAQQRTPSTRKAVRPKSASRRARGSMSRDEILDAARHLIALHGMRQLSMPGLARELGSGVTSIYWYFRNKDELLESLATEAIRESSLRLPPVGDGPWDEELVEYFGAFRALLHSNPVYREIGTYRPDLLTNMSVR
ncbi:MAG: TetR/AcrR family transcriptional regulator, partial [Acidimicrobiia bacterium]